MKLTDKLNNKISESGLGVKVDGTNLSRLERAKPVSSDLVNRMQATGSKKLAKMALDLDNAIWDEVQRLAKELKKPN